MAIRLRHDVAALGANLASGGSERRKYGQQLVQQQRKYDMEQMQAMQDRAFDMQKQQMQNAWQEDRDFRNNLVSRMAVEQEQDFRAKQAQEARQFNEQGMARQRQQSAFEGNVDMATRMAQEALKRDDVPGPVKERLRNLIGGAVAIRGKEFDDTQASKFAPEYYAGVSAALADVPPPVPIYEQMNKNLVYRLPDGISYVNPKEYPEGTPFVVKDVQSGKEWISSPAGQPQLTPFEAFAQENKKDAYRMVQEEMGRLSEKVAAGEMKFFESEDALRQAALRNVQSGFNLVGGMSSGAPGQPVAPTTTQSSSPQSPVVPQQSAVSPAVMNTVGNVLDTFPDTEMMAMSQLGREALVENGFPQGQAQAPVTPPATMPTDRAGMVSAGVPQGVAASAVPAAQPLAAGNSSAVVAQPQQTRPLIAGIIGEALKTFESGTQEQKTEIRKKMGARENVSALLAEASANNPDAIKVLDLLEMSIPPTELVGVARKKAKSGMVTEAADILAELRVKRELGEIDDQDYVSAIVSGSGKTSKKMYEEIREAAVGKKPSRKSTGGPQIEQGVLNTLWDEMGMFDSRASVRAFQKMPTMDEVISHVAMKGKMSRSDAEEYVYNQILARKYTDKLQKNFESSITGGFQDRMADEKRDAWKPVKQ